MTKFATLLFSLLIFTAADVKAQGSPEELDLMLEWMTGTYATDGDANRPMQWNAAEIWPENTQGKWVYAEIATSENPGEPTEQIVFFITSLTEGELSGDSYRLPEAENFVGAWKNPSRFDGMTAFDLKYRDGCTMFIGYDGFQFDGRTGEETCPVDASGEEKRMEHLNLTPGAVKFNVSPPGSAWNFLRVEP